MPRKKKSKKPATKEPGITDTEPMQVDEVGSTEQRNTEASTEQINMEPESDYVVLMESLTNREKFIELRKLHQSKKATFDFGKILSKLSEDDQMNLWAGVLRLVESDGSTEILSIAAIMCKICLGLTTVVDSPPEGLRKLIELYSRELMRLHTTDNQLANSLARCLELWYDSKLDDRDEVVQPVISFLISRILGEKGTKADVARLWNIHKALLTQRLDEEGRKETLLRCVAHPAFLSSPEGIGFNRFLLSLSAQFVPDSMKRIRDSLPNLTNKQSYTLGEVYMKAMKDSGGSIFAELKTNLQKLMDDGMKIHRLKHEKTAKNVASFLKYFNDQKNDSGIQTMLAQLYCPFMWRYLEVPSLLVRTNAAEIFFTAYPVEDMSLDQRTRASSLKKQHELIPKLMFDKSEDVRIVSILGVGRILSYFWNMLPSNFVREVIGSLVHKLRIDDSDYRVRVAVFQSLKMVLENSDTHVYLKKVLPKIKMSFHDVNESVRASVIDLILAVKNVRVIKFWEIVSLEHILSRLTDEGDKLSRSLVLLLLPSFFPKDAEEEELLQRAVNIVTEEREAARKFYKISVTLEGKETLIKLMIAILDSVRSYLKKAFQRDTEENKENRGNKRKLYSTASLNDSVESTSNTSTNSTVLSGSTVLTESNSQDGAMSSVNKHPYSDLNTVGGLLDIVCIVWDQLSIPLAQDEYKEYRALLEKKASNSIIIMFRHYRDTPISDTVVLLASFLSHSSVSVISSYCLSQLKKSTQFEIHLDALCYWRRGDEILNLMKEWILAGLSSEEVTTTGVRFREPDANKPKVGKCIRIIDHLLDHQKLRVILLAKNEEQLVELLRTFRRILHTLQDNLGFSDLTVDRETELTEIFRCYLKLTVLMGLHRKDIIEEMEDVMSWADHQLTPVITRSVDTNHVSISLAEKCTSCLLDHMQHVVMAGAADEDFLKNCLYIIKRITCCVSLSGMILDFLCESSLFAITSGFQELFQEHIPVQFVQVLREYTEQASKLDASVVNPIKMKLRKFVRQYEKISKEFPEEAETLTDILETLSKALLMSISREFEKRGQTVVQEELEQTEDRKVPLGEVAEVLLGILQENTAREKVLQDFILSTCSEVTGIDVVSYSALVAHLKSVENRMALNDALSQLQI